MHKYTRLWERRLENGNGHGTHGTDHPVSGESRSAEPRTEHNSVTLYAMNGSESGHYRLDPTMEGHAHIVEVFDGKGKAAELSVPIEGDYMDVALVERPGRPSAPPLHVPIYSNHPWQKDIIPAQRDDLRNKNLVYTAAATIAENPEAGADALQEHIRGAIGGWKAANPNRNGPTQPSEGVDSSYWIG